MSAEQLRHVDHITIKEQKHGGREIIMEVKHNETFLPLDKVQCVDRLYRMTLYIFVIGNAIDIAIWAIVETVSDAMYQNVWRVLCAIVTFVLAVMMLNWVVGFNQTIRYNRRVEKNVRIENSEQFVSICMRNYLVACAISELATVGFISLTVYGVTNSKSSQFVLATDFGIVLLQILIWTYVWCLRGNYERELRESSIMSRGSSARAGGSSLSIPAMVRANSYRDQPGEEDRDSISIGQPIDLRAAVAAVELGPLSHSPLEKQARKQHQLARPLNAHSNGAPNSLLEISDPGDIPRVH